MAKHTEGPWRADGVQIEGPHLGLIVATARTSALGVTAPNREEAEANALLIAAVIDLLDALKAFVDACGGNPPDWLRDEYAKAESAIAKAEDGR